MGSRITSDSGLDSSRKEGDYTIGGGGGASNLLPDIPGIRGIPGIPDSMKCM